MAVTSIRGVLRSPSAGGRGRSTSLCATDTSFSVEARDASVFPGERYCVTLDSDTRLPRGARVEPSSIPLRDDGRPHLLGVVLGTPSERS